MRRTLMLVLLTLSAACASGQQVADSSFDTRVAHPAFVQRHPRVVLDQAHHNFHTAGGRYKVFADLMTHDGCVVSPGVTPFSAASLRNADVLVISNALGHEDMSDTLAERPAFSDDESDAVRDWVRGGGALLLIADHAPMGAAARSLGERFGVSMRNGYTIDAGRGVDGNPGLIEFTPASGLDTTHAIMRGRDRSEAVRRVMTFTGQSLVGPDSSRSLLTLSPTAIDMMVGYGQAGGAVPPEKQRSAAGRSQALAVEFGQGRVVALGEAAMLSAQLAGRQKVTMGMNYPGIDNRQFALNTMRWLNRAIE